MKYTIDYFIDKFKKIPENKWCSGGFRSKTDDSVRCATGHCGLGDSIYFTHENFALFALLNKLSLTLTSPKYGIQDFWNVTVPINDGHTKEYQQSTPKARILAALNDVKKMQDGQVQPPAKVITKYVSVPESLTTQVKQTILS